MKLTPRQPQSVDKTTESTQINNQEGTTVELKNGGTIQVLSNGNVSGTLPSLGLVFEAEPRRLKHTQKLEAAMGGSSAISDYLEEAALRLFSYLLVDCSEDIGRSDDDRLAWLLSHVPEYPDGVYLVDALFSQQQDQTVEVDRVESDIIFFTSGHTVKIGEDGTRIGKFPESGKTAVFRPALLGDSNAITRAMGGAKNKANRPVETILRTMTRLCQSWDDGSPPPMSTLANLKEGEDSQYLAEIYTSFRTSKQGT